MSTERTISSLFRFVETLQGGRAWGSFLDAGTGSKSLDWVSRLTTERWTAVTASRGMAKKVRDQLGDRVRARDRIVVGNWIDESLFAGELFDTVLMDYFIGAIEGFAPYWQDRALHRIRPLVKDRLYIIGVEPYVTFAPKDEAGRIVWEIGRLRDACLLLAGERPYREYPLGWVQRHLGAAGFRMIEAKYFPIRYRARFVNGQLDMCLRRLEKFDDPALAEAMRERVERLRARAMPVAESEAGLKHGADYVIAAEPLEDSRRAIRDPEELDIARPV